MLRRYLVVILVSLAVMNTPVHAQLEAWSGDCVYTGGSSEEKDKVATFQGIECLVKNFLAVAISLVGVAVFVMVVYGGYQILMSNGDAKGVEAGKATITYALLGLVLALGSWFIINLIATFTGASTILDFSTRVPGS